MAIAGDNTAAARQDAQNRLQEALEEILRLDKVVQDGHVITDWAIVGATTEIADMNNTGLFAFPGQQMATWQLHGLLDTVDTWVLSEEFDRGPEEDHN